MLAGVLPALLMVPLPTPWFWSAALTVQAGDGCPQGTPTRQPRWERRPDFKSRGVGNRP